MSSRKQPLSELRQPQQTPSRYQPSTPHAIRALQQRSGAKTRSLRLQRTTRRGEDVVRPDSARGILRQLAKITAPATRKNARTVTHDDKENARPEQAHEEDDDEDEEIVKRPRLTLLDIEESAEFDDFEIPGNLAEEDSEILMPPTPSILPDDDDQTEQAEQTDTFKAHDLQDMMVAGERLGRRKSAVSVRSQGEEAADEDEDPTILSERGRRAVSEDPTGRLSRYSFGSIRMSDFGSELEVRRTSDKTNPKKPVEVLELDPDHYEPLQLEEDTGIFQPDDEVVNEQTEVDHQAATSNHAVAPPARSTWPDNGVESTSRKQIQPTTIENADASTTESGRRRTTIEQASAMASSKIRKKPMKLTRYGHAIRSLPTSLMKRIAVETQTRLGRRKPKLGSDHVKALEQATEWFFEQLGEDLEVYSNHAGRKKRVAADDVLLLMKRQRIFTDNGDLQKAAKTWLPAKVLEDLELPERP